MVRKKIVVALLCLSATGFAQTITKAGIATQFNQWRAPGTTNLIAGANALVPIASCAISAGGVNTYALAASTPIKINDPGNPAIDEIITPTVVVQGVHAQRPSPPAMPTRRRGTSPAERSDCRTQLMRSWRLGL